MSENENPGQISSAENRASRRASSRMTVREQGSLRADAIEVFQREFHTGLARDRQQVEDRLRGPAGGHCKRHAVLQGCPCEDLSSSEGSTPHTA